VDVLTDPAWLAVIVALLTIAVTGWVYWRQRVRKDLSYDISRARLVSVGSELQGRVKVLLDDRQVKRVDLVRVELRNSGNATIRADDFETPIALALPSGAELLTVDADETEPKDLKPRLTVGAGRVEVEPLLLNPRDRFVVKALVSDLAGTPQITGRIAGVSRLSPRSASPAYGKALTSFPLRPLVALTALTALIAVEAVSVLARRTENEDQHSKIVLRTTRNAICGDVFSKDTKSVQVHLTDGSLRRVGLDDVASIKAKAC
jgi:hypothetical protein